MNPSELAKILELHKVWISSFGKEGSKANLYGANLYGANLYGADLSGANLYGADLSG
ncbi:pentapeptide repeat-containing protein, partial [Salmonella enterica]|nr:pentapeptide repeat-containing protein [Salmonella enterica]